jgi:hypothetical protein
VGKSLRVLGHLEEVRAAQHLSSCSGADAARAGSKISLRASHEDQRRALEWADLCPPTYDASPKRWTERANGPRNSHCTPTARGT